MTKRAKRKANPLRKAFDARSKELDAALGDVVKLNEQVAERDARIKHLEAAQSAMIADIARLTRPQPQVPVPVLIRQAARHEKDARKRRFQLALSCVMHDLWPDEMDKIEPVLAAAAGRRTFTLMDQEVARAVEEQAKKAAAGEPST